MRNVLTCLRLRGSAMHIVRCFITVTSRPLLAPAPVKVCYLSSPSSPSRQSGHSGSDSRFTRASVLPQVSKNTRLIDLFWLRQKISKCQSFFVRPVKTFLKLSGLSQSSLRSSKTNLYPQNYRLFELLKPSSSYSRSLNYFVLLN